MLAGQQLFAPQTQTVFDVRWTDVQSSCERPINQPWLWWTALNSLHQWSTIDSRVIWFLPFCLSNLSYSLINVSAVATAAVSLNARLNLFMKWGVWICGQALSSVRLLVLIISQRASLSLSLRLSLPLGDMISAEPHQSAEPLNVPHLT